MEQNESIQWAADQSYSRGYIAGYMRGIEDCRAGLCHSSDDSGLWDKPIPFLKLSKRPINCLEQAGYRTVGDIASLRKEDIWKIRNLGRKGLHEIAWALWNHGIRDSQWNDWLYAG